MSTALAGLAVLTGCASEPDPDAGTNGVGRLSAGQIEKKARAAAEDAPTVRLAGTLRSKGQTYTLRMRLGEQGGSGEVAVEGGTTFQVLRVDDELFLTADAAFWARQEGGEQPGETDRAAAAKLAGKYVRVPASDPAYDRFAGFTERDVLLEALLVLDGERAKGPYDEVDGARTVEVHGRGGAGGRMQVALKGTPYPLALSRPGDAGTVRLSEWGARLPLEAPVKDDVVDYGKEISAD